jgi:hypothetical protein
MKYRVIGARMRGSYCRRRRDAHAIAAGFVRHYRKKHGLGAVSWR